MLKTIIALDPGGTTGWAYWRAEVLQDPTTEEYEFYKESWDCGQLGPSEHHLDLYNFLGGQETEDYTIVSESFEYRNKSRPGLDLSSKEYIGVAKVFCQERGIPYYEQTASMGKGFVKDANIKRLGLWSSGWKHAMDAYRHLLYYMINTDRITPRLELLKKGWH